MYYNFLVEGEIFGFDPSEYQYMEEYTEDVPYDFCDNYDFYVDGSYHMILFFFDAAEMGIQSFYAADNGEIYKSNIMTLNCETGEVTNDGGGSVSAPMLEGNQVKTILFTDLQGRRVANPTAGIYVKTVVMQDGTTRSSKVVIR